VLNDPNILPVYEISEHEIHERRKT
jgi:hypothetical protein